MRFEFANHYLEIFMNFCSNVQRPGTITGMTMDELQKGRERSTKSHGVLIVTVKNHKGVKPAKIMADGKLLAQLLGWADVLRPLYLVDQSSEFVFPTTRGITKTPALHQLHRLGSIY